MSKQIEAELRAARNDADDAVDAAMTLLDGVATAAVGASVVPRLGATFEPGVPIQAEHAVVMVPVPFQLMAMIAEALNSWRKTKGTVQ